ncbi:MAG: hypothetical protein H6660_09075 [Ardenticatenaceae bacterium]|nr:hypothetical protein [Ardenticatenaceae bacterium]
MLRPFHLRDLPLVLRLSEHGASLHSESALINDVHPLRGALFNLFVGGEYPTYVWRAENGEGAGFIQLHLKEEGHRGHILYVGSTANAAAEDTAVAVEEADNQYTWVNEDVWLPLLEQAVVEVGQRGIHSLIAEVSETGPELVILRQAGFAVYTRQDIWTLNEHDQINDASVAVTLQPRRPVDDWDIQLLYANIVPRLVQLVEPLPPLETGKAWVLREGNELTAFVHLNAGETATWLRLFIHPNAESRAEEITQAALQLCPYKPTHPLFCSVPRYQSWLQGVLQRCGFAFWDSQAVMVKHTVHHLRRPLPELTAVLESQGITASSPIVQQYYHPEANGHGNGRKAVFRFRHRAN